MIFALELIGLLLLLELLVYVGLITWGVIAEIRFKLKSEDEKPISMSNILSKL